MTSASAACLSAVAVAGAVGNRITYVFVGTVDEGETTGETHVRTPALGRRLEIGETNLRKRSREEEGANSEDEHLRKKACSSILLSY